MWEPEHKGMTAVPKFSALWKLHCRDRLTRRTPKGYGEAEVSREETGECTGRAWRGKGLGTYTRTMEITSGRTIFQQGLAATCKDLLYRAEPKSAGGIWFGA